MRTAAAPNGCRSSSGEDAEKEAFRTRTQGANVNAAEADGTTALHWASYRDDVESADLLIRAGARVNAANDLGATALWTASLNGGVAMVRRLLEAGANPNAALLLGETPVMVAARSGHPGVIETTARRGAPRERARCARASTRSCGQWRRKNQRSSGCDRARCGRPCPLGVWSQVMAAPPHGLLEYNRAIPHGGDTELMFRRAWASGVGDAPCVRGQRETMPMPGRQRQVSCRSLRLRRAGRFLLDRGAEPNAAQAGFTALHAAIMRRDEKVAIRAPRPRRGSERSLRTWTPTRRASREFNFAH